jgi:hypothetical protein
MRAAGSEPAVRLRILLVEHIALVRVGLVRRQQMIFGR